MGVRRLFSRGGKIFQGGRGQEHTICLKKYLKTYYFLSKKSKTYYFGRPRGAGGGTSALSCGRQWIKPFSWSIAHLKDLCARYHIQKLPNFSQNDVFSELLNKSSNKTQKKLFFAKKSVKNLSTQISHFIFKLRIIIGSEPNEIIT